MAENWAMVSPLLADEGYCVSALTYGAEPGDPYIGGLEPIEQSSLQLAAFIDQVLAATGASKVDLVGHSEGTVMPQYYLKFEGGAAKVGKYVALAPLYQGTTLDGITALDTRVYIRLPRRRPPSTSSWPASAARASSSRPALRFSNTSTATASTRCPASSTRRS